MKTVEEIKRLIRDINVIPFKPSSNFQIGILEGPDPSSYFFIRPVKVPDSILNCIHDDAIETSKDLISIEESDISCFLAYFLQKYFDPDLIYNRNRSEVLEDYDENIFQWYLTENYYTYDTMEEMLRDILNVTDMLIHDYYNPALDAVKKDFSILYMTNDDDEDHKKDVPESTIKKHIYVVVDFYLRFANRIRKMIDDNPDYSLISFSGP